MEKSDRKVITRSPSHGVSAIIAGGILDNYVEAESKLEGHFIRRAALIPSRPQVIHQPFRLPITSKGYTPDFLLHFPTSGFKAVAEIKLASRIDADYTDTFDKAALYLRRYNYTFFVLTEFELLHAGIHKRAKLLTRYAKERIAPSVTDTLIDTASKFPSGIPLGSLSRKTGAPIHQILSVIARGKLTTGPRLKVDASAVVFITPKDQEADDEVRFCRWFDASPWNQNA